MMIIIPDSILGIILPIDELIFFRVQTTKQSTNRPGSASISPESLIPVCLTDAAPMSELAQGMVQTLEIAWSEGPEERWENHRKTRGKPWENQREMDVCPLGLTNIAIENDH